MKTAEALKGRAEGLWRRILEHPFVAELYRGVLPMEKFRYYLLQDYNYLVNFARALSLAAGKAPDLRSMKAALELAHGTVTGEMANYEALLAAVGLSMADAERAEPNRVNRAYMDFLLATCALEDFHACMAAVLPCFWTYLDIARRHADELRQNPVEAYRRWASVYLSPEYGRLVEGVKGLLEGGDPDRLWPYFRRAAEYELEFWQAAYAGGA